MLRNKRLDVERISESGSVAGSVAGSVDPDLNSDSVPHPIGAVTLGGEGDALASGLRTPRATAGEAGGAADPFAGAPMFEVGGSGVGGEPALLPKPHRSKAKNRQPNATLHKKWIKVTADGEAKVEFGDR